MVLELVRALQRAENLAGRKATLAAYMGSLDAAAMELLVQVNELAFTRDGKLFMQATSSGVEVQHPLPHAGISILHDHM